MSVVRVRVMIGAVVVDIFPRPVRERGRIGLCHLRAEIEFWNTRNLRKINTRIHQRHLRVCEWRGFVVRHSIVVQNQPISQSGNPVTEIESAAAVAAIGCAAWGCTLVVPETGETSQEHTGCNGTEHDRTREAELQVLGGLKTNFLAVNRWKRRI